MDDVRTAVGRLDGLLQQMALDVGEQPWVLLDPRDVLQAA
jgi:hypothetical protein